MAVVGLKRRLITKFGLRFRIRHHGKIVTAALHRGRGNLEKMRVAADPFYANGFIPTVRELVERIQTGDWNAADEKKLPKINVVPQGCAL